MRIFAALAISATLLVGGCATLQDVPSALSVLTKGVQNPAGKKELAVVELSYQTAAKAFVACRKAHCTSVANLRKYQEYDRKAYAAIVAARPVVRQNPTISGLSAVRLAQKAVADYNTALGR